ncbi:uncharacterized protein LOC126802648 [Argentina anserina]|uniref:uncharacterized protein LOC126802648 n=1 Tax=Argentina anserina TaxID=57926 RepID=UPI00217653E8|nr:uncharacterized protein LOC126802648 [Potentilla anserina]
MGTTNPSPSTPAGGHIEDVTDLSLNHPLPSANDPFILTPTPGTVVSTNATTDPATAARMESMARDLADCQQREVLEREKAAALQSELDRIRTQLERAERSHLHEESNREGSAQTRGREQVRLSISLTPSELAKKRPPSPRRIHNREEGSTSVTSRSRPPTAAHNSESATLALILQRLTAIEQRDANPRCQPVFAARPGPFTTRIMNTVRPSQSKSPKITPYIGEGDPFRHIDNFKKVTASREFDDATLCHLFSETLDGDAMNWFFEQPANSMDSFAQLTTAFLNRFILMAGAAHTTDGLFQVKQESRETLGTFVMRWQTAASRCRNLNKTLALAAFKEGLRSENFLFHINVDPRMRDATYDDIMTEAVRYAQAEYVTYGEKRTPVPSDKTTMTQTSTHTVPLQRELFPNTEDHSKGRKREWHQANHRDARNNDRHRGRDRNRRLGQERRDNRDPRQVNAMGRRSDHTLPREETLEDFFHAHQDTLRKPARPLRPQTEAETGKWCRFHENGSHNTNDCRTLRTLRANGDTGVRPAQQRVQQNVVAAVETLRRINVIEGGAPKTNLSNRAKKRLDRNNHPRQVYAITGGNVKRQKEGWQPITFTEDEEIGISLPNDDAFLIDAILGGQWDVGKMMIDTGSAVNVLFKGCYEKMERSGKKLVQDHEPLVSFSGDITQPLGSDYMTVRIGTAPCTVCVEAEFIIVDAYSSYNGIIGRPTLNRMRTFIAGHMMLIKFPTPHGTGQVRGSQSVAKDCQTRAIRQTRNRHEILAVHATVNLTDKVVDARDGETSKGKSKQKATPYETKIPANPESSLKSITPFASHPARKIKIGATLNPTVERDLTSFLGDNMEVFAWSYEDMPGISPDIIMHELHIKPSAHPIKQKRRSFDDEKSTAIRQEVDKLRGMKFVREVQYPEWISNCVMVRKANGKWRMCVDYKNVNKACPKDSFPLPRIDQLIDATAGHELLSMMDAYSGYNQIRMNPADQEATTFVTDRGLYCYNVMPFGLKNAGATYVRCVTQMFDQHIGREIEVYVDDMLAKSIKAEDHVTNLRTIFNVLKKYKMRLNPEKCFFGVTTSKFLGYIVSQRGIEANPEKIQAILDMAQPTLKKDVEALQGRLVALSRFISRLTDKCEPFFRLLRRSKSKLIEWTPDCQEAFQGLKDYLAAVPLLSTPQPGEPLYLYLAVSTTAVSSALVRRDGTKELPVFYAGRAMNGPETRYPTLEQLALALIVAARRLRHYFQAHSIHVLTNQPLKQVLQNPEHSGRLSKWAIELTEFDIEYRPRPAIKGQAVADFIAEMIPRDTAEVEPDNVINPVSISPWNLHVYGSSCAKSSGAGIILSGPGGLELEYALKFNFAASNNVAEYEALIAGLQLALSTGATSINVFSDSQLVVNQITGSFTAKDEQLAAYLAYATTLLKRFEFYHINQIPRANNARADSLARLATAQPHQCHKDTRVEILHHPSIHQTLQQICQIERDQASWMDEIVAFKCNGKLPEDETMAKQLRRRAVRYYLRNNTLYRQGLLNADLKCVTTKEGKQILNEIHSGDCGNHYGSRALAAKTLRTGYYWPTLASDAQELARSCHKCQIHGPIPRLPSEPLSYIVSPWINCLWGMDLIGPLPVGKCQFKWVIVCIDYHSKWIEAAPLTAITTEKVQNFLQRNIFYRHGTPESIITDNGTQFNNEYLITWCKARGTKLKFASVAHPKTNGQVEAANKLIKSLLRKKLGEAKGLWPEKLDEVVWAIRTTPTEATGETPFCLMYGTEAVLPIEVIQPTQRVSLFDPETNSDSIHLDKDLLEEKRITAHRRNIQNKQRVARFYNSRVKSRTLQVGDWVLKKIQTKVTGLRPRWDGPYKVVQIIAPNTYCLEDKYGEKLAHPWNMEQLKYYYK